MTPDLTEAFDVFLEYRLTSMLLSLVVTIVHQDSQQNLSEYEPPLENSLSSRRRALNALASILVRNVEAVALTTSGPTPPPSCCTSLDTPNTIKVLVMQEENNSTPLPFTMVPNSSTLDPPIPVQGSWLSTIPPGRSKWAEIMASPWSCVAKPNEILSLSDHLATTEQYLNEYQLKTQPTEPKSTDQSAGNPVEGENPENSKSELDHPASVRRKQFDSFFTYLISTCYPKVRRQLSNRLSKKLFSLLSSITGPQLEHQLEMEPLDDPGTLMMSDLKLCKVVQSGEHPYDFQAMVHELKDKHYQPQNQSPAEDPGTQSSQKASPLFEALTRTIELNKSGTLGLSQLPVLYTKETCVDFHYLLLFALNKYSDAVTQFYDHVMDGSLTDEDRQDLRVYSYLLWCLAYSSTLRNHLKFLCKLIPQNFMSSDMVQNGLQHGQESQEKDNVDIGGSEGMLEDEDMSSDDGGVKEEMAAIECDRKHRRDPALMIQRWIGLLVSHLQALHLLSSFASLSPPTMVRIQHVAVKSTTFETPQDWTGVLKRALTTHNGPFLAHYSRLEEIILEKINAAHEGSDGHKGIFSYFKGKDALSGCGKVHCEAGLAVALYSPPWQDTIMKEYVFDGKNVLTGSRICCPLCWELLGYLRIDRFCVRGRSHSVPTPMELPGWINRETAATLLGLLRNRLSGELASLIRKNREDNRRNQLSLASDDNLLDLATLFNL